jgi:hypothetical protein
MSSIAVGLPQDRAARLAARRSFVELKQIYLYAVAELPGRQGEWLRAQVRACEEPFDLWLLRAVVLEALDAHNEASRAWRSQLKRGLQAMFPEPDLASSFVALAA